MKQQQHFLLIKEKKATTRTQKMLILLLGISITCAGAWLHHLLFELGGDWFVLTLLVGPLVEATGVALIWSVVRPPLKRWWLSYSALHKGWAL